MLGEDHPATLRAMQGKAKVMEKEKNYPDALELHRAVAAGLRGHVIDTQSSSAFI